LGKVKSRISHNRKIKFLKIGIFVFPLVFIFLVILDKILFGPLNDFYFNFAKEDGPVELSTAVFYFLSFLLSAIIGMMFVKQKKKFFALLYFLLSAVFFFIAFEEISWGQRILMFETPEYFAGNIQNEMSFHNMPIINDYKRYSILLAGVVGFALWGIFTHFNILKIQPFTKFFVPQGFTMSYFIAVIIFYGMDLLQHYIPKSPEGLLLYLFSWPDHEVFEFLLSVGIFIFVASKFIDLIKQKRIAESNS